MKRALPLKGLRIADFTWIGAGAYTTRLLADLGADVIKIESRSHLDSLRNSKPFAGAVPGVNRSGYFADRNAGKRSITLNLKTEEGRSLARRLVMQSDIVANNFTPGTMEKFGLGYDELKDTHPSLVYLSMSMQGASGPEAKYLGYGLTMGALTGLQYIAGMADREPAGTGTNFPDHVPNPAHAAFAVLIALRYRERTGEGQLIDLAQIEPTIALLGPAVLDYTANGRITERVGNQHAMTAPYGVYPCAGEDRWIAIGVETERQWEGLVGVLECAALGAEGFRSAALRWQNRVELNERLAEATRAWDAWQLTERLQAAGVSAGAVNDARDALHGDPQLAHRGHWAWLDHPEMGRTAYGKMPFRLSSADISPSSAAPCLGEHTESICRDLLGMDDAELARLKTNQVLW